MRNSGRRRKLGMNPLRKSLFCASLLRFHFSKKNLGSVNFSYWFQMKRKSAVPQMQLQFKLNLKGVQNTVHSFVPFLHAKTQLFVFEHQPISCSLIFFPFQTHIFFTVKLLTGRPSSTRSSPSISCS